LAIGSERYVPYAERRKPRELLTCANAVLGQGQLSLAKYLLIVAREDDPELDINNVPAFFRHLLERVDWQADLHFQTCTTMDTLDYSGTALNEGSKLVVAAAGPPRRPLASIIQEELRFSEGFGKPRVCLPGVLAIQAPPATRDQRLPSGEDGLANAFCQALGVEHALNSFPLVVLVDDSDFVAARLDNFLWVTFTRSDPAADVYGVGSFTRQKHWGCVGTLVIDARLKPHHAPPLEEDPAVARRVDALGAPGAPLHGII
jgi:4-hydroxy-3-polyprenylbenzoate decarboxylase